MECRSALSRLPSNNKAKLRLNCYSIWLQHPYVNLSILHNFPSVDTSTDPLHDQIPIDRL
jgi:hypothetical protein